MADATNVVAINIWTARIIPPLLVGIIGYATYVVVGPLSGMRNILSTSIPLTESS